MTDAVYQFLLGIALGSGISAYVWVITHNKTIKKLKSQVSELNKQVDDLITACNLNTKHIDELVVASTDTTNIVAEHIDEIKELKKGGN